MKQMWSYIKTFKPPLASSCVLAVIFSALSIIEVATSLGERFYDAVAYGVYICAAISLTLAVWAIVRLCREISPREKLCALLHRTAFTSKLADNYYFRTVSFTYLSFVMNITFAIAKGIAGWFSASWWLISLSAYYIILCVSKLILLRSSRKLEAEKDYINRMKQEWKAYRTNGTLLLGMTLVLMGVVVLITMQGNHFTYYGNLIFAVALWDFYCLINAIVYMFRNRRKHTPIIAAIKITGFATALVSILSLQTAMFASFGGEMRFQNLMNLLTGTAVCIILFVMGIAMVIQSNKQIRKLKTKRTSAAEE